MFRVLDGGLSIAWGLVEHFIEETKALTLFATHYHELIDVVEKHAHAKNLTVETISHKGNVQFLYRLIEQTPLHLKELEEVLANMDVMQMTLLEALVKLNQLKSQIDSH